MDNNPDNLYETKRFFEGQNKINLSSFVKKKSVQKQSFFSLLDVRLTTYPEQSTPEPKNQPSKNGNKNRKNGQKIPNDIAKYLNPTTL